MVKYFNRAVIKYNFNTMVAVNRYQCIESFLHYHLYFVERPVVTPPIHNVSLGTNITFECTEFGSPPFTYQWFMRNTSMEGSDKLLVGEDKNTYNISSVLYNHTGLYFCEASNMLGILSNSTPASLIGKNALDL